MRNLFIIIGLIFFYSFLVFADSIPEFTNSERIKFSSDVVWGRITDVKHVDVGGACPRVGAPIDGPASGFYVDTLYYVTLNVYGVEKGSIKPGESILISFWRATRRPGNWNGPTGQINSIKENSLIRAYLNQDNNQQEYLPLEPNGFDIFGYVSDNK